MAKYTKKEAYTILGLSLNASESEIEEARKSLITLFHPDNNTGKDEKSLKWAEENFNRVQDAYESIKELKTAPVESGCAKAPQEEQKNRPETVVNEELFSCNPKLKGTVFGSVLHIINMIVAIVAIYSVISLCEGSLFGIPAGPKNPVLRFRFEIQIIILTILSSLFSDFGPSPKRLGDNIFVFGDALLNLWSKITGFLTRKTFRTILITLAIYFLLYLLTSNFYASIFIVGMLFILILNINTVFKEITMTPHY